MFNNLEMFRTNLNGFLATSKVDGPPEVLTNGAQLFYNFLIFIFVIILAYYLTKVVAHKRMQVLNSKNIKVLEMVSLGVGVSIGIVKVGTKHMLVSVSKEKITLLTELDGEDLTFDDISSMPNFQEQFKKLLNTNKGKKYNEDNK